MEHPEPYKVFWTTKELAGQAKVSDRYVRQLLENGVIKGEKRGRDWSIPASAAREWLESRKKDR